MRTATVERFRTVVAQHIGLKIGNDRTDELAQVLTRRAEATGTQQHTYLDRLAGSPDELSTVASQLVVNETYFFRHVEQFNALGDLVTPGAHILSAGCSSGEEPYTIAMVTRERAPVRITAVDIDPRALEAAEQGHYSKWSLRATPAGMRRRWFHETDLDPEFFQGVHLERRNLADPGDDLPGGYDVIFCRNVLMYFTPEAARTALEKLTQHLRPGGHLFLGHAETVRALCPELCDTYKLRQSHDTFYYQKAVASS